MANDVKETKSESANSGIKKKKKSSPLLKPKLKPVLAL